MPHERVIIASDRTSAARATWWASELPHFWPRASRPAPCRCVGLDELSAELAGPDAPTSLGGRPAVVLIIHRDGPLPALMQLADRLLGTRTPALVLAEEPERLRAELEPHGLLVEPSGADRATVARVLHALVARQPAVESVSKDLRIARASQGGLSGEIARLHDELHLAGAVQRRFLPKTMPELSRYDFGVLFRPVGYVSGDIYDLAMIDESRVAFMVADAVGHGVPAALLTLVLGRALRSTEPGGRGLASPAQTLSRLNAELCLENEAGDRFATAVCGVIDTKCHRVTLASAGHPSPIVISRRGNARTVTEGHGPLLGVFEEADFPETTFDLDAAETLLLVTDGFETAFPEPGAHDGVKASLAYVGHFARLVGDAESAHGGLRDALERLGSRLDAEHGSLHQRDDLTALALRRVDTRAGTLHAEPARVAA